MFYTLHYNYYYIATGVTFNFHSRREIHHFVGVRVEDAAHHGRVLLAALLPEVFAEETLAAGLPEAVVGPAGRGRVVTVTRLTRSGRHKTRDHFSAGPINYIIILQDCDSECRRRLIFALCTFNIIVSDVAEGRIDDDFMFQKASTARLIRGQVESRIYSTWILCFSLFHTCAFPECSGANLAILRCADFFPILAGVQTRRAGNPVFRERFTFRWRAPPPPLQTFVIRPFTS